jgi:hypothetical protein
MFEETVELGRRIESRMEFHTRAMRILISDFRTMEEQYNSLKQKQITLYNLLYPGRLLDPHVCTPRHSTLEEMLSTTAPLQLQHHHFEQELSNAPHLCSCSSSGILCIIMRTRLVDL